MLVFDTPEVQNGAALDELTPMNFHSTKLAEFDGKRRLTLAANN